MPLEAVFDGRMSWGEAFDLTLELARDQSSRVGAALGGWTFPATREALVLADIFDVTLRANSGRSKPKPYPRPWDIQPARTRATQPQSVIRAALEARGHGAAPDPTPEGR